MPLEINELNIKINLSDSGGGSKSSGGGGSGDSNEAQEALIQAVLEKVLTILKEKEER